MSYRKADNGVMCVARDLELPDDGALHHVVREKASVHCARRTEAIDGR
ncbi:MAG: hypothetical protein ACT4P4_13325 [Betaproteobacteria bacterium]